MFDGIKVRIKDGVTNTALLSNHLLDFTGTHKATGEEPTEQDRQANRRLTYQIAEYKHLTFKVYDSSLVEITGSIHYYFNDGEHNYNQFTIKRVRQALDRLVREFSINLNTATVHNLEIGANLLTPFNPDHFINNLIVHKQAPFNIMEVKHGNGRQTVQSGKQYGLKVYNKGMQYATHTSDNLLRFEIKCLKMEAISSERVYLSTLLDPAFINQCKEALIQAFDEVLVMEPVDIQSLTLKERDLYLKCVNPGYWNTLSRIERCRQKKRFVDLLCVKSKDPIKETTRVILVETLRKLTAPPREICNVLTNIVNALLKRSDHLCKVSIRYNPQYTVTTCITCGRDITGQRKGSRFCSEKIYGKSAKRCRNTDSNPRNNYKRTIHYAPGQKMLFDLHEYTRSPQRQVYIQEFFATK